MFFTESVQGSFQLIVSPLAQGSGSQAGGEPEGLWGGMGGGRTPGARVGVSDRAIPPRSWGTPGPEGAQFVPAGRGTTVWRLPEPARLEMVTAAPKCCLSEVPFSPRLPRQASATRRRGWAQNNGPGAREQRFAQPREPGAARGRRG